MKFAKELQSQLNQEWYAFYLAYKEMKKVLKKEEPDVVSHFCDLLESEVRKVHAFMKRQQEEITAEVRPLELHLDWAQPGNLQVSCKPNHSLDNHCMQLVQTIENFRNYSALNHKAVRKIIKKFDKRFNVRFYESCLMPSMDLLVQEEDIGAWLLEPAEKCLTLIRQTQLGSLPCVLGPIGGQFNFWVEELKVGSLRASMHSRGADPWARARLEHMHSASHEQLKLTIRNTFIDSNDSSTEVQAPRRRANSLPPCQMREKEQAEAAALLDLGAAAPGSWEQFMCEKVQVPEPQQAFELVDEDDEVAPEVHSWMQPPPRPPPGCRAPAADAAGAAGLGGGFPAEDPESQRSGRRARGPNRDQQRPRASQARLNADAGKGGAAAAGASRWCSSSSTRWWTDVNEVCPLTGFPIRLLPYPPFRLPSGAKGSKDGTRMVDGSYLVVQVLSSLRWEVLGRALTASDVQQLDLYMKKCKLGPFRLGRALELLASANNPKSMEELEQLRAKAKRRLVSLKHIQRMRLNRGG